MALNYTDNEAVRSRGQDVVCTSSLLLSSSTRRRFTLSDLLDKPLSQVSSLLPPRYVPSFLSRIGFSIPTARRFSWNVANSRSRAFRYSISMQEKVHSSMCTR